MNSLYIHIPFCEKKCLYCSFVVSIAQEHRIDDYLDCLEQEADRYQGTVLRTIYIGGGTPTHLSCRQLERLAGIIKNKFVFTKQVEWTIEANPEDMVAQKADLLRDLGVTRLSLGVQSFQDRYLRFLGRCHDAKTAERAFGVLRKAGFDNINVDLMYAFPKQDRREVEQDVRAVLNLTSEHISLYTLTVEENSRFYAQKVQPQNHTAQAEQYEMVGDLIRNAGLRQYEVSNFAKPAKQSLHNLNYWQGGDYIGLGVGAHSHQQGVRRWNVARLSEYCSRLQQGESPEDGCEELNPQSRLMENLLIGLRMNAGIDVSVLQRRMNARLAPEQVSQVKEFISSGMLEQQERILKATPRGRLLLDEISARLI